MKESEVALKYLSHIELTDQKHVRERVYLKFITLVTGFKSVKGMTRPSKYQQNCDSAKGN